MKINLSKQYNEKLGKKLRMKVTSAFFNCTKIKWGISIEARVSKFFPLTSCNSVKNLASDDLFLFI